jgi:hypothetical protein
LGNRELFPASAFQKVRSDTASGKRFTNESLVKTPERAIGLEPTTCSLGSNLRNQRFGPFSLGIDVLYPISTRLQVFAKNSSLSQRIAVLSPSANAQNGTVMFWWKIENERERPRVRVERTWITLVPIPQPSSWYGDAY